MSMRMTDFLGYLTLFAILGAIWVLFGEDPGKHQGGRGELYFPAAAEQARTTTRVTLQGPKGRMQIKKTETDWVITGDSKREGYPVSLSKLQKMMQALTTVKRVEPKTLDKDRFTHLDLLPEQAITVTLSAEEESLLSFRRGKIGRRPGAGLAYAYQDSDSRAWLVSGMPSLSTAVKDWIDLPLYTVSRADIQSVILSDGTQLIQKDGTLTISDLKAGEQTVDAYLLGETVNQLAMPKPLDIMNLSNPLSQPLATVTLTKTDGTQLSATLFEVNGGQWVQFSGAKSGTLFQVSDQALADLLKKRSDLVKKAAAE